MQTHPCNQGCILATVGIFVLALLFSASQTALGQEAQARRSLYDKPGIYVYVSYFKIPWARIDSLIQLNSTYNAVTKKGREMGCYADRKMLIHQTADEYNVVFKTYHEKWYRVRPGTGCGQRAFRAVLRIP